MPVLRALLSRACLAALWAAIVLGGPVRAQSPALPGSLHAVAVPDGLHLLLGSAGDAVPPARAQALVDFIRRTYDRPVGKSPARDAAFEVRHDGSTGSAAPRAGTLPLPLPPDVWIDTVFGGRETHETLLSAILGSRGTALFYHGLLSLDDDTRAWLVTEPKLIAELAGARAAPFVVAAPGLRVREAAVDVPGGPASVPSWEALVGHGTGDPAGFTRALLARDHGRLAFFYGSMAELTPGQVRVVLALDSPDPAARVAAARRLRAVFERLTWGWRVDNSAFSRPAIDPALLLASLRHGRDGLPVVPGTRRFWEAVFGDRQRSRARSIRNAGETVAMDADALDFTWLCEQVFTGRPEEDRRRYHQVLFASRLGPRHVDWSDPDAIAVVRAVRTFPALVHALERTRLDDVAAFAAAVRRAEQTVAIRDDEVAARTLAQFQGALALVTRAASRGAVRPAALAAAVSSLSRVEFSDRGDYEGRLVRWLDGWLAAHPRQPPSAPSAPPAQDVRAAGPMERDALAALAGPADAAPRFVDWEGTRYRIDFASAEALRIDRLLGARPRPFLSSARRLVEMADTIGREGGASALRQQVAVLEAIAVDVGWNAAESWEGTNVPRRYSKARAALRQAAGAADIRRAPAVASGLLELADDLAARGLMELAYAVALGQPDRPAISADEAGRRHDFAQHVAGRAPLGWELPVRRASPQRGWHMAGAGLGLDVQLADFGLRRLSLKPPPRAPTLSGGPRRVLIETVALVGAASLADEDHAAIVSAIRNGRARLAAARTSHDAAALAAEVRLSPARRTLLSWTIANDRARVPTFLALRELFWLGLGGAAVPGGLHAWGAPAWPRTGCLCLEMVAPHAWETLAGRPHSAAFASGFSDLNLRLAELLDDLGMPAPLLAPVLAAATLDLVETVDARDGADHLALLDFVHALRPERVEQYLALLTTDGPLVPVDRDAPADAGPRRDRVGAALAAALRDGR